MEDLLPDPWQEDQWSPSYPILFLPTTMTQYSELSCLLLLMLRKTKRFFLVLPSPCKVSTSPEPHTLVAHCPPPLPSDPAFIMAPIANVDDGLSGEARTFTCLSGGSNREISFYFDGEKLEEGVSGDTLTIPSTTTADTGVYQCIVENDSGTDGTSWYLIVRDPSEWCFCSQQVL